MSAPEDEDPGAAKGSSKGEVEAVTWFGERSGTLEVHEEGKEKRWAMMAIPAVYQQTL
jgi:hypothetical protein